MLFRLKFESGEPKCMKIFCHWRDPSLLLKSSTETCVFKTKQIVSSSSSIVISHNWYCSQPLLFDSMYWRKAWIFRWSNDDNPLFDWTILVFISNDRWHRTNYRFAYLWSSHKSFHSVFWGFGGHSITSLGTSYPLGSLKRFRLVGRGKWGWRV